MGEGNGLYKPQLDEIQLEIHEVRTELATAVNGLTTAVEKLTSKFDMFMTVAQNSIPIKAVFWLMGMMVLGLVGIEGVKQISPILKFWMTGLP